MRPWSRGSLGSESGQTRLLLGAIGLLNERPRTPPWRTPQTEIASIADQKEHQRSFCPWRPMSGTSGTVKHALQNAIELEHSTLPLYAFATYAIQTQN